VLIAAPQAVQRPFETLAGPPQLGQFIEEWGSTSEGLIMTPLAARHKEKGVAIGLVQP
jgi:hypothetical protein